MKSAVVAYEKKSFRRGCSLETQEVTEATRSMLMLLWAPGREQLRDPRQGARGDPPPTLPGQLTWSPRKSCLKSQQVRWGWGGGQGDANMSFPCRGSWVSTSPLSSEAPATLVALWMQEALGSPMLSACHWASECSAFREEGILPAALDLGTGSWKEEPSPPAPLAFYLQIRWYWDCWHGGGSWPHFQSRLPRMAPQGRWPGASPGCQQIE